MPNSGSGVDEAVVGAERHSATRVEQRCDFRGHPNDAALEPLTRLGAARPESHFDLCFVFALHLAHQQRASPHGGSPVDPPQWIAGRVVAQADRVGAAARGRRNPLARIPRATEVLQAANGLERGEDERVLARGQRQRLREEPERKARKYPKFFEFDGASSIGPEAVGTAQRLSRADAQRERAGPVGGVPFGCRATIFDDHRKGRDAALVVRDLEHDLVLGARVEFAGQPPADADAPERRFREHAGEQQEPEHQR